MRLRRTSFYCDGYAVILTQPDTWENRLLRLRRIIYSYYSYAELFSPCSSFADILIQTVPRNLTITASLNLKFSYSGYAVFTSSFTATPNQNLPPVLFLKILAAPLIYPSVKSSAVPPYIRSTRHLPHPENGLEANHALKLTLYLAPLGRQSWFSGVPPP
ncbi:MAG: hypothetical protein RMY62_030575 [Nostoc sp. ZfuVER08]|uniref:hypothetical protein n=1 Tax=Nostoc punctiforme TaxID=272131 RepID=UPI001688AE19|nr:hypothetical protein [Nostoc punctiforme]MDZ8011816.1 hypothetical protein [Nostoc sp. ZfuVER08]